MKRTFKRGDRVWWQRPVWTGYGRFRTCNVTFVRVRVFAVSDGGYMVQGHDGPWIAYTKAEYVSKKKPKVLSCT